MSSASLSDSLFVHRDTPKNNPDVPFEFTKENVEVRLVITFFVSSILLVFSIFTESQCHHKYLS